MKQAITLVQIFNNDEKLYAGKDLWYYAKKLFYAKNARNQYHNFNHMMHVTYQVYDAIKTLKIPPVAARYLLIAAMFHDYGHTGDGDRPDSVNIARAVRAIKRHILYIDKKYLPEIIRLIRSTEWLEGEGHALMEGDLFSNIMKDADLSQTFAVVWIQPVIFGLGYEKKKSRGQMLRSQLPFLTKLKFFTEWGAKKFGPILKQRIEEVKIWEEKVLKH